MSSFIDWFVRWGERLVDAIGYPGLAIIMFLENVFPPIPSEPFLLGAGFATADGRMSLPLSILAATIGSLIGATVFYYIGIVLPEARIRSLLRRYGKFALLGEEDLDRALAWFVGHGGAVVFFGRCIPLVRTLISVPAGLTRMPLPSSWPTARRAPHCGARYSLWWVASLATDTRMRSYTSIGSSTSWSRWSPSRSRRSSCSAFGGGAGPAPPSELGGTQPTVASSSPSRATSSGL